MNDNDKDTGKKFCELLDIISRLRGPGGCPWDQKQTVQTFKPYLLEETHELSEALDNDDTSQIKEELGDLFFQLGFINQMYQENEKFSMTDVLQAIIDKMIRRHPHVFEGKTFESYEEMRKNWARVKEKENTKKIKKTYELDVPKSLPALSRSQKVAGRAARTGFDWPDLGSLQDNLSREFAVLMNSITADCKDNIDKELGDFLFLLVNLGRKLEINSEECLHSATNRFISRFKVMEKRLSEENLAMDGIDSKALLEFWRKAKENT
ncbi:MAG: nucleoside triphosphate pyrophosphohydrolase [Deltaproteobacteria bacterium]|nr:nucleoside triphosphate pyrophosphohydrolase [Deltaproteobacteria bacterium]